MTEAVALEQKYLRAGPRYTSYPAYPHWEKNVSPDLWPEHLKKSYRPELGVDLYIHIPFCQSLCAYCGCNRVITKDLTRGGQFLDLLIKEWDLYLAALGAIKISSLHLGGGTPNFLSPKDLNRLLNHLAPHFKPQAIKAMEADPRTLTVKHIKILSQHQFQRLSFGIQDFNQDVQAAITRIQPYALVKQKLEQARANNINQVNMDLIYGLPRQSLRSMRDTIEKVIELSPEMIAFYSYAHVPWKAKNQNLIKQEDLPGPTLKKQLFDLGRECLLKNGYSEIGFDHFAKADSILARAKKAGKLTRNFMGFTHKKSNITIGLGPTSISDSSLSYMQNQKDLKVYEQMLGNDTLPLDEGHIFNRSDQIIGDIIQHLMCNGEAYLPFCSSEVLSLETLVHLHDFSQDGLISWKGPDHIEVTPLGRFYLRNICMAFDQYHDRSKTKNQFSKTI